jgi:hypothetical protein
MADEEPEHDPLAFIQKESPLEDVQRSNILFNRTRLGDFCSLYFSLTSVGLSVIAYEIDFDNMSVALEEDHPNVLVVNVTMWLAFVCNICLFISIVLRHTIYFKWIHSKKLITRYDTMRSTGHWKIILTEILVCLIMPLPFINTITYTEIWISNGSDPDDEGVESVYKINYILLAAMTYIRLYTVLKCLILITFWSTPRAQRVW